SNERPTIKSVDDELVLLGDGLKSITEVWLHPSPTCDPKKDNRSVEMVIVDTSSTFIAASLAKSEKFQPEWFYPIFVCTKPPAKPAEFLSVILEDTTDPLLPLLLVIYVWFLMMSALFTGLNLALMSLDLDDLRVSSDLSTRFSKWVVNKIVKYNDSK
ncbi:hypothetical protein GCK32_018765, partial [Trichostrongylus colubriformis]